MLRSSGAVGAATLISRVLGFVRESVYAAFMGDGRVASAFFMALTVPNLFRRLLGEGALTAAFVPVFKEREAGGDAAAVWRAAGAVFWAMVVVCAGVVVAGMAGLWLVVRWVPLRLEHELPARLLLAMFPYLGFVCVAALFIGVLNARNHFFLPALGAALLNVVMIASVYLLAPRFGATREQQVFGLAVGLVLAGLVQAVFQWPALRREGFRLRWVNPWRDPTVREVARRMAPATLGVAAYQFNVVFTQALAYSATPEAVASFNYAVRLMELPQGVVGVSLATYLLSELSRLAVDKDYPAFRRVLGEGLQQLVFLNGLAAALLFVLAEPIIRLLFERGSFGPAATLRATSALMALAPGLVLFSMNNVLARAFYALGDTHTPMRISVFCLGVNALFALFLIPGNGQAGMGLANTLSAAFNTGLLLYALRRKLPKFDVRTLAPGAGQALGGALLAGGLAWAVHRGCEQAWGHGQLPARLAGVFGPMLVAGLAYFGAGLGLGNAQARELAGMLRRRRRPAGR
ncbi:MAG: murein biosynthesis integral membrane protein MurJ [Verrucomicrobiota bacterium]